MNIMIERARVAAVSANLLKGEGRLTITCSLEQLDRETQNVLTELHDNETAVKVRIETTSILDHQLRLVGAEPERESGPVTVAVSVGSESVVLGSGADAQSESIP